MIGFVLKKVFGSKNDRELKKLFPIVERINGLEDSYKKLSDSDLRAKTTEFRSRHEKGESLDDLLPDAFAAIREASLRVMGMRHFDVQLIGGMVLHSGKISEMKTGEGKTLTATLAAYLNALSGKGVHIVTVNDYLARRDAEWMGRLYGFLGLTTGCVVNGMDNKERKAAYGSDITYGQNNEFGFDFLRDNMKLELSEMVQRPHNFAIVDEVDSILIDESRTPLIISGPSDDATDKYAIADAIVRKLNGETDFTVEAKTKNVLLTDDGVKKVENLLRINNLYDPQHIELVHHLTQSLKAHVTMFADVDYVVREGQVIIVDEFTGRLMAGRRWSDGLHQAVEAKEGVTIARENQTLATITFQNYFRMYKKLAGMTGTADTEAVEFKKIYNLDVVVIPPNRKMIRVDNHDVVFSGEKGKFDAVVKEIEDCVKRGQPTLVGTASIAKSELLSSMLQRKGIRHHVLNAKHHEREAEIIAQAGRLGMVTISTNMAGRGTDILLGGNPEFLAAQAAGTRDPDDEEYQHQLEHFKALCNEERAKVIAAGGLHIVGTERHESRRIDNQLRGRAGRQGDPGSSRFYISLQDDLMKRFGGESMQALLARVGLKEDEAIEGRLVGRAIENAQKKVEGYHFDVRKHLLEYDNVMNKQRQVIYSQRDTILRGENIAELINESIPDVIEEIILTHCSESTPILEWDIPAVLNEFKRCFGIAVEAEPYETKQQLGDKTLAQKLFDDLKSQAEERYMQRSKHFGVERMKKLQRMVYLQATDYFWKEHLSNMDHLKEGIGLRGYGQQNPLFEYQREAFAMFKSMLNTIKFSVLQNIFIPELPSEEEIAALEEKERELLRQREAAARTIHESALEGAGSETAAAKILQLKNRPDTKTKSNQAKRERRKGR
jgi:preprotein translocase subunit SecA